MKESPILFSTPMVNSISGGHKFQTRRTTGLDIINKEPDRYMPVYQEGDKVRFLDIHNNEPVYCKSPYGQKDDLLWVRETFHLDKNDDFNDESSTHDTVTYKADNYHRDIKKEGVCYDDIDLCTEGWVDECYPETPKWKPSIHMPKRAARIWLLNEDIRIQRLHDISNDDAIAEGIKQYVDRNNPQRTTEMMIYQDYLSGEGVCFEDPIPSFQSLWISINGRHSWDANPWVWIYDFSVLSIEGRPSASFIEMYKETF